MKISTGTHIDAPIDLVWHAFNDPNAILHWDNSDDWAAIHASNDLRLGGLLRLRMKAKNGGEDFNFTATYTRLEHKTLIEWRTDNDLYACVEFIETGSGVTVRQTFDAEPTPSVDEQRLDWQSVLDNFARYVATIAK